MAKELTGKKLHQHIVKETQDKGFLAIKNETAETLKNDGFVETNPEVSVPQGHIAARATQKLIDSLLPAGGASQENATVATNETAKFSITRNDTLPPAAPRGGFARGSQYPFEQLGIGDSFFVPKTDAMPNPARTLSSAVTAAMKRAGKIVGSKAGKKDGTTVDVYEYSKQFVVRPVDGGAKVFRIADYVKQN
jgi:hypothetical protein